MLDLSTENHDPDCLKKKLKNVCRTRWVDQITGLDDFEDLYISIIFCLESMSFNEGRVCNREISTEASSFYKLIASFDFIATLVLTRSILDLTLPVTELLQGKEIDMTDASHLLDSLKNVILSKPNNVDELHYNCYRMNFETEKKVSINETKPRTDTFQKIRDNVLSESVSDYFEIVVSIPLLDHLFTQLNVRFDGASVVVYGGLVIVQVKMLSLNHENIDWRQTFRPFAEFYRSNLPCSKASETEIDLWEAYWLNDTSFHLGNISSTLKRIDFKSFSNIKVCLRILGTLPVTTCTCERSFLSVRRLKT